MGLRQMKVLAYIFALVGTALIFFGISRFSPAPLWHGKFFDAEVPAVYTNYFEHTQQSDNQQSIQQSIQQSGGRATKTESIDLEEEPENESQIEISKSPISVSYNKIQECVSVDAETNTKGCLGYEAASYREYRQNILTNFKIELSRHIKNLKGNTRLLIYEDELLARKILQNEERADIQRLGLELLSLFPASNENLIVLEGALVTTTDANFLKQGFTILESYQNLPGFDESLDLIIKEQIRLGVDQETTTAASQALLHFMTEERFSDYQAFYNELKKIEQAKYHNISAHTRVLKKKIESLAAALQNYKSSLN